jgi:hypothetical protein
VGALDGQLQPGKSPAPIYSALPSFSLSLGSYETVVVGTLRHGKSSEDERVPDRMRAARFGEPFDLGLASADKERQPQVWFGANDGSATGGSNWLPTWHRASLAACPSPMREQRLRDESARLQLSTAS